MKMKLIIVLLSVFFSFGVVSISFAGDVRGKIVRIKGAHDFYVKDNSGKEVYCQEVLGPDMKVGDMVTVKGGEVTKDAVQDTAPTIPSKKKNSKGK